MKRPIAMLLALLLTAGLFAFAGCGEKKNYTVEEVNGIKRIFLDQSEIDRIYRELDEKGWSATEMKGVTEDDYFIQGAVTDEDAWAWLDWDLINENKIKNAIQNAQLIAKCHVVDKPQIFRLDDLYQGNTRLHESCYVTQYTLKIEKVFYTDGEEKVGDVIRVGCSNFGGQPHNGDPKENSTSEMAGYPFEYNAAYITPPEKNDFYIVLIRAENARVYGMCEYRYAAFSQVADFSVDEQKTTIIETQKDVYEFDGGIWSRFGKSIEIIPKEERPYAGTIRHRLKTDNFDEMFSSVISQYLMEVEE